MKRDIELIRSILIQIEKEEPLGWLAKYGSKSFSYHLRLLKDADFVEVNGETLQPKVCGSKENSWQPQVRLKWKGHDFVDAARDDKVWKKFLEKWKDIALDLAVDVLKEMGKEFLLGSSGRSHTG